MNDTETVEATVVAPQDAVQKLGAVEGWAASLTITTPADYETAVGALKKIKALKVTIQDWFADSKQKAHAAWKAIVAQESGLTDRLDAAEKVCKLKLVKYQQDEEEKRIAEQRRLQAIADERARKEREKAEAAARIQREKEAAAQREADEARRKAQEATNAKERDRLNREAEARQKAANDAAAKAAAKTEQAAQVFAPVIEVAKVAPTVAGTATKKTWAAKVVNAALVPREFLVVNEKALDAFAKATRGSAVVAGVEFFEVTSLSVSTKG